MSAVPKTYCSPEDYLSRERDADFKSEYLHGEIFAMAGASERHNIIAGNLFAELHRQLRDQPCRIYISDMRVKVDATGLYTYPDVTVVCGTPTYDDERRDTLTNPLVIIEVLSPWTAEYDRGGKFLHYRSIPGFAEYVLVSQDQCLVEHYVWQAEGTWLLTELRDLERTLELPTLACSLPLTECYRNVAFDEERPAA